MKLEKNHLKWLPIIPFVLFSLIILIRPMLFGFDPYYYYSISCGTVNQPNEFNTMIWLLLDCNLLYFKLLIIACAGIFLATIYYTGRIISKEYGPMLPLLMGLSPLFFLTLGNAEDDLLGLPFIGLSLYFLIKSINEKRFSNYLIGLGIILIGSLVWPGILIWLVIYLIANPLTAILGGILTLSYWDNILVQNKLVSEDIPIAGLLTNSFLILGIFFIPGELILPGIVASFLSFYKLKYAFYLTIFGSIGVFYYLVKKDFFWNDTTIVLGLPKVQSMLLIILLFNLVGMMSLYSNPSQSTLDFVKESITISQGHELRNDWELGHLITAMSGKPSNAFGPPDPDYNGYYGGYAMTQHDLNCKKIISEKPYTLYYC